MFAILSVIAALLFMAQAGTGAASAQEYGLSPSHVFSLWTNVNDALVTMARTSSHRDELARRLNSLAVGRFQGKKPADVLDRVFEFRDKLDQLRQSDGLGATKQFGRGSGMVTPSIVFLSSGQVLDALVLQIIQTTDSNFLMSPFYTHHDAVGRTPSDVFGLVDLASRRIDLILAGSKS